jgi:hypothetical protein
MLLNIMHGLAIPLLPLREALVAHDTFLIEADLQLSAVYQLFGFLESPPVQGRQSALPSILELLWLL